MNQVIVSLLLTSLTVFGATRSWAADSDCQSALTGGDARFTANVDGWSDRHVELKEMKKRIGVPRHLPYTAILTKAGQGYHEDELFTKKSDLIIGIDTTGNTQGHMYLIINDQRFDGRMFFAPATVTKEDWVMKSGLIIRYHGLPDSTKDALAEWLKQNEVVRTPTCVAAACKVLFEIAAIQNGPDSRYWFPSSLLKHIADSGLVTAEGTRLTPEIFVLNSDINLFWNNLPTFFKVPNFIFQVLFDPYTWKGAKKAG